VGIRRVIVGALVAAGMAAPVAHASDPVATLGVYRGPGAPDQVAAFDAWRGGPPSTYALDFIVANDWNPIAFPYYWANAWRGSRYRVVYSVPMLPSNGATLAIGATGAYDPYFAEMARNLVAAGQGNAILRIGWEFNGDWYPWSASQDPAAFVAYWQRIVDAIRAVPGAHFTFDWAPNLGRAAVAPDSVYPGDAYVDVIGLDVHDQDWSPAYQDPAGR
jgi:Glycosyl hydrolase family 26